MRQRAIRVKHEFISADRFSEIKTMLPRSFRFAVNVTPGLLAEREFNRMCLELIEGNNI